MSYAWAIFLFLTLLVYNKSFFRRWYKIRLIPQAELRPFWKRIFYIAESKRPHLEMGYKKFSNTVYRIQTLSGEILVLSPKYYDDLKILYGTCFNFVLEQEWLLMSRYTKATVPHIILRVLGKHLGPKSGKIVPQLFKEAQSVLESNLAANEGWTPIAFFEKATTLIASVSGISLAGSELNRNEEWIQTNIDFVVNTFKGADIIRIVPSFLRPVAQYLIPSFRTLEENRKTAYRLALPIIKKRMQAKKGTDFDPPNDFVQWLLDENPPKNDEDIILLVHCLLMASLASIHLTTMTLTQAIYDLAYRPEYAEPLRAEVQHVLDGGGVVTKQKIAELEKMDSFLKESQRMNPAILLNARRLSTEDCTLSDGTFIPAGSQVAIPSYGVGMDPAIVPDPLSFQGFRWYEMRKASPKADYKFDFATTSNKQNTHFGLGKHACCGRFFVSDMLKIILSLILTKYDIALKDPEMGRPKNFEIDLVIVPNFSAEILFRKRV